MSRSVPPEALKKYAPPGTSTLGLLWAMAASIRCCSCADVMAAIGILGSGMRNSAAPTTRRRRAGFGIGAVALRWGAGTVASSPEPGQGAGGRSQGAKPLEGEWGLEIYQQGSTGSLKGVIFFCASRKPSYIRQVTSVRHIYIYY